MKRLIFALMAGLPGLAFAQLTGEFQFNFTDAPQLWDFTGTYALSNQTFRLRNTLVHAPSGAITGTGSAHYNDGLVRLDATHLSRGRVTGSAASRITSRITGAGQFSGNAFGSVISGPFNASISLTLDPTNRTLFGSEAAMICVRGRGCRTLSTNVNFQLPDNVDGAWILGLNVATSNNVVRGTAAAQLANGRTLSFNVRGAYVARLGISRLKLIGTGDALGRRLSLRLDSNGALETLNGNLFGQRLVFPLP